MSKRFLFTPIMCVLIVGMAQFGHARDKKLCEPPQVVPSDWQPAMKFLEPAQVETLYSYDFDDGPQGFQSVDGTDVGVKWQTTDQVPTVEGGFPTGKAWWCGEEVDGLWGYGDWWFQVLETPEIDLREAASPALTVDANWAIEPSGEEPPDWDAWTLWVSTDGGVNFDEFIEPIGGYSAPHDTVWPYSFHGIFFEGGVPGFNDSSHGWVNVEFDLSDFVGQEIVLRVAYLSDQCFSTHDQPGACGEGTHPEVYGVLFDNFSVDDGGTNLFFDNADDQVNLLPGYIARGCGWERTDANSYSPDYSFHMDIDEFWDLRSCWVESPWMTLDGMFGWVTFWVYIDAPDQDGNNDNTLDDYYFAEVTEDGRTWRELTHDYMRYPDFAADTTEEGFPTDPFWAQLNEDVIYNGTLDLARYAGSDSIKIRFRSATDMNDDGGNGEGMYIDNILVEARGAPNHDAGVRRIDVPFPNTAEYATPVNLLLWNFGLQDLNAFFFYQVEDTSWTVLGGDSIHTIVVAPTTAFQGLLPAGVQQIFSFNWTPAEEGVYRVLAYQFLPDDWPPNDSMYSDWVYVSPPGQGILMDHHYEIRWIGSWDTGEGPAMKFVPPDDIPTFNIVEAAYQYPSGIGTMALHVMAAGTDTTPGPDLIEPVLVNVPDDALPNLGPTRWWRDWYGVDLSGFDELKCYSGVFWTWAEVVSQDSDYPLRLPYANDPDPPSNSFEFDDGEWSKLEGEEDEYDATIRTTITWPGLCGGTCEGTRGDVNDDGSIDVLDLLQDVRHFLGEITLTGDALCRGDCNGDGPIDVLDMLGIAQVILGTGQCAPGACRADLTPEVMEVFRTLRSHLTAEEYARFLSLVKVEVGLPLEYGLAQNYPNPFNPITSIEYSVAGNVRTTLKVYNVLGQELVTLMDEVKEPGHYSVSWDAGALASGVYFYRLDAGEYSATRRMVLMK